ncbi:hypothetical protein [Cellulomonas sp. ATA003]|uniref:hypothetical protein n=1 Tax=Cellulomonas sp. ATA003 TaxID=3073064 RepID=UPI0028734181|nr:hypothetical protein [Cellulomonas sp. ATA003]WNB85107.1 hypothetical protein REH70_15835 [Cellulomonas sp. ATA003]
MTGDGRADPAEPLRAAAPVGRRGPRRAVRSGAGEADPLVDLRAADDSDVGWQTPPASDTNDERLRRDVPPHW